MSAVVAKAEREVIAAAEAWLKWNDTRSAMIDSAEVALICNVRLLQVARAWNAENVAPDAAAQGWKARGHATPETAPTPVQGAQNLAREIAVDRAAQGGKRYPVTVEATRADLPPLTFDDNDGQPHTLPAFMHDPEKVRLFNATPTSEYMPKQAPPPDAGLSDAQIAADLEDTWQKNPAYCEGALRYTYRADWLAVARRARQLLAHRAVTLPERAVFARLLSDAWSRAAGNDPHSFDRGFEASREWYFECADEVIASIQSLNAQALGGSESAT